MIRHAAESDLPRILEIYDIARQFMRQSGNMTQWINGYPSEPLLRQDIMNGNLYVMEDEGGVYGAFAFILGDDPTYAEIEGAWQDTAPGRTARVRKLGGPADIPPAGGHPRGQPCDAALHPAGRLFLLRCDPRGRRYTPRGL